jgi:hypothetical protein
MAGAVPAWRTRWMASLAIVTVTPSVRRGLHGLVEGEPLLGDGALEDGDGGGAVVVEAVSCPGIQLMT